jgi:hypothetical protein
MLTIYGDKQMDLISSNNVQKTTCAKTISEVGVNQTDSGAENIDSAKKNVPELVISEVDALKLGFPSVDTLKNYLLVHCTFKSTMEQCPIKNSVVCGQTCNLCVKKKPA